MVARNRKFQSPAKGYSRNQMKREAERFVDEDYSYDEALRRLSNRLTSRSAPPVDRVREVPVSMPTRFEPILEAVSHAEPESEPVKALKRQPVRRRHRAPRQEGWFARLWRRLGGR